MKQTINFYQFCDGFKDMNRNDNFSYEGKRALFDWLEELDDSCGTETEFDVIALCCDFNEYVNWEEFIGEYEDYCKENEIGDVEALRDHTQVIETEGDNFIIQAF